jgi:hypothetical protein
MSEDKSGENELQNAGGLWFAGSWKKGEFLDAGTHETPRPLPQGGFTKSYFLPVPEVLGIIPPHTAKNPTPTATAAPNRPPPFS